MRAFLLPLLLLTACSQTVPATSSAPETLDEARARWAAADLDDYRMTLTRSCFCPEYYRGPFEVAVDDGEVTAVGFQGRELPADRVLTVDALFDLLAEAYASGAARVEVTYDATLGYPTSLYIDQDEQMADEEVGYTVEGLSAE